MKQKATLPLIAVAVIGLIAFILYLSRSLGPPEALHTAPPSFIDPVTGKPKGQMQSTSGATNGAKGAPASSGKPAGQ